jgi:hypothetical protein
MYATTQSIYPIKDVFGAYIPEQHCDVDRPIFLPDDSRDHESRFEGLLASLRSALGIRRK